MTTASPTLHPAVRNGSFDVEAVRADFPALSLEVNGYPLTYLDNAASAQKPRQVIQRMVTAYEREYSNVHRGLHYLANAATEAFEQARESVRGFLNAASVDEIIFTRSGTGAINTVASSLGQAIEAGDEIVLSIMEHHSNIVPWHFLRERKGAVIKWAPVREDGSFDFEAFKALLTERTKIVAITQMSNVLGTVTPIKEIAAAAHAVGAKVLVDGCQSIVHMPVDVRDLDVDFFAVTGHKLYAPTGIGVLYGKLDLLAQMPPYEGGGEMIREVTEDYVTYGVPPHRFEAGTPPIVQAIGLGAAVEYVNSIGRERIAAHEHDLSVYAHERLGALNSLRIIGTAPGKGGIISFEMKGAHPHDVATIIDRYGVAVRAGTHCAQPLLARYGATATCRASFALYNTRADVDRLVDALVKAQDLFA
ncbi:UNVERIFIED_ORG: cysteine desulfurase/selenocysteine lyase [Xanthobacter viscosus]|jgi:cysteine desulfurase/selenocysteine lyase|uniref:Cysteine desulfurase n=1 Tax=Xanthobacter autotrophicus TaxID=280 RepID=A0A6C1KVT7_XANAU|nr:cysteine desulfurase [Xanthobacter autotrophicus]TLX43503.1 cysteine desulfurase [Xanthobacter autotrophicus]